MGATETLAREIVATADGSPPSEVVEVAREVILDGCANFLAGSREPLSEPTVDYVRELGGPEQATVAGHGFRTHPVHAAYANGVFCHAMDFELMWYPPTHPTSTTLPALLALAEQRGSCGEDVISALATAFEVQGRLRLAIDEAGVEVRESLHPPGQVGAFGAAAGCAVLLELDVDRTRTALGIAGSRVSGLMANTGTMTKSTHCGNAARLGLESALLAERGFTASGDVLEATHGYNDTLFQGRLDLSRVTDDFGDPYRMVDPGLTFKKYPSQYPTHWSIDAALELRRRHGIDPDQIKAVEVEVGADNEAADRTRPETGLDGKFSVPYTVAVALLDGTVNIDTFRDERRFAPDVERMLERVTVEKNPEVDAMDFARAWSRVTVETENGEEFSARVDRPPGIWDNPVPWEVYLEKFHHCAGRVLRKGDADELAGLVEEFETLEDVRALTALLGEPTAI